MNESEFEDIICKYPELIEDGLSLRGRQVPVGGKRADVLFQDKHGHELIVELKRGTVVRKDIAQLLDYEGYFLSLDSPTSRVMLVGNRIPENFRRSLEHHGLEWKQLAISSLVDFLKKKNDSHLLPCVLSEEPLVGNAKQTERDSHDTRDKTPSSASQPVPSYIKHSILEDRYSLSSRLSLLSIEFRTLFLEFHNQLVASIGTEVPLPRTHIRGITYRANDKKAFLWVNFNKNSISLNSYSGKDSIPGLPKTTWRTRGDMKGGLFHIRSKEDIPRAVEYGKQAYRIALRESRS